MPGLARKAVSKSPLRTKAEPLNRTASFALHSDAATPPAHVRKRSLSASRRAECEPVQEYCVHCDRWRERERVAMVTLSDMKYQVHLWIEALSSWRTAQNTELQLPNFEEPGTRLGEEELSQQMTELARELNELRPVITSLTTDIEVLSRHAVWENVSIVRRKEAPSRETVAQKVREAKSLLASLRHTCTSGKAAPQLSSSDPALVRSLKLQLQQAARDRLACEVRLQAAGKEPEWLDAALLEALEVLQLA